MVETTQTAFDQFITMQVQDVGETFADVIVFGGETIEEFEVVWTRTGDPSAVTFTDRVQAQEFATEFRLQPLPKGLYKDQSHHWMALCGPLNCP